MKLHTGRTILLTVTPTTTLLTLKIIVRSLTSTPVRYQRMVFDGKQMDENSFTLLKYKITMGSTVEEAGKGKTKQNKHKTTTKQNTPNRCSA